MSLACNTTEGITFIGSDSHAKKIVKRINDLIDRICDLRARYNQARFKINLYCDEPLTIPSSSSSSSQCFPSYDCEEEAGVVYKIKEEHLTDELIAYLDLVEENVCETTRLVKEIEAVAGNNCFEWVDDYSSSSSSISSSVSSSSSLSSSVSSSSSVSTSSSSSAVPLPCLKTIVMLNSDCESLALVDETLVGDEDPDVLNGFARYIPLWTTSSMSSSSSGPGNFAGYAIYYVLADSKWYIEYNGVVIAEREGSECIPYGAYVITTGPCSGELITVE